MKKVYMNYAVYRPPYFDEAGFYDTKYNYYYSNGVTYEPEKVKKTLSF